MHKSAKHVNSVMWQAESNKGGHKVLPTPAPAHNSHHKWIANRSNQFNSREILMKWEKTSSAQSQTVRPHWWFVWIFQPCPNLALPGYNFTPTIPGSLLSKLPCFASWRLYKIVEYFCHTQLSISRVPFWLSGIQHCHCCGSGFSCGMGSIPGLGTSLCYGYGQKPNQTKTNCPESSLNVKDQLLEPTLSCLHH